MQLNPCLFLTGNAEEALRFYRDALGGKVDISRFKDAPTDSGTSPDWADKVMYGTLTSPYGVVAAMDAPPDRAGTPGENFGIGITTDSEGDAASAFQKLSSGGAVMMPYEKTFYAEKFGMVRDKYGVTWMVSYRPVPVSSFSAS